MNSDSIIVKNIEYSYGDIKAVDKISFTVKEGEIFGFLGPNGAGKSTTIKLLTGQLNPKKGKIAILGKDITKKRGKIQADLGICFERTNLYEQMSGLENLKLFADLFNVKNFDGNKLLLQVDILNRGKDKVSSYSKGMKQRLMFARSLVNNPKILFLDEPTEGLDPMSANNIRNLILQQKKKGTTIFLTTHDMYEADKLSDRVAFINCGEIAAIDTPFNLKQKYGNRTIKMKLKTECGEFVDKEINMDNINTAKEIYSLFKNKEVITIHSEEASLEDIFIKITGTGLSG